MPVLACLIASTTLAHAHGGGGGPEVVLPPIFTSGLLGFVCYWLVMLWPSSTKKGDPEVQPRTQSGNTAATRRTSHQYSARVKQKPRLRKIEKIERRGQFSSDTKSGRKVHDV
ncbi:MAG: hypothetical protein ACRERD_03500 [Candidatus Binatia bacterium]